MRNGETLRRESATHERRRKKRFPLQQEVRYIILYGHQIGETGSGRTLNVSSGGIFFTTKTALSAGTPVEVSMRWPILLRDSCPMMLHIHGCVIHSGDRGAAVAIERYEFRTQAKTDPALRARQETEEGHLHHAPGGLVAASRAPETVSGESRKAALNNHISTGTSTILVVDDEPVVRRVAQLILQKAGYQVFSAGSASEAISVAERLDCRVDLLLTDMEMPHGDGHELIAVMRRMCPQIESMVFSGFMAADGRERDYAVLAKPFTMAQLLGAVKQVLDGQN